MTRYILSTSIPEAMIYTHEFLILTNLKIYGHMAKRNEKTTLHHLSTGCGTLRMMLLRDTIHTNMYT